MPKSKNIKRRLKRFHEKNTPENFLLHRAIDFDCKVGDIKPLLNGCADINHVDTKGNTPLHWALTCKCQVAVVQLLIARGAFVNVENNDGDSPLHCALSNFTGKVDKKQLLLDYGVDTDQVNANLQNLSFFAMRHFKSKPEVLKRVMDGRGPDSDSDSESESPLSFDCQKDVIQLLLEHDAAVNSRNKCGNSPLHCALKNFKGQVDVVELLLDRGADVNAVNDAHESPLRLAVRYCDSKLDLLTLLLDRGANVKEVVKDKHEDSLLHYAIKNGSTHDAIDLILDHGADINILNKSCDSPLLCALKQDVKRLDVVKLLLDHKADLSIVDRNGRYPLHAAILGKTCRMDVIKLILDRDDVTVDVVDSKGNTALHFAVMRKLDLEVFKLLLHHGSNVNVVNTAGNSPLRCALRLREFKGKVIKLLLQHGANVNEVDRDGNSLLHCAVSKMFYRLGFVKLLLHYGARVNIVNNSGVSPLQIAIRNYQSLQKSGNSDYFSSFALHQKQSFDCDDESDCAYLQREKGDFEYGETPFECVKFLLKFALLESPELNVKDLFRPSRRNAVLFSPYARKCVDEILNMKKENIVNDVIITLYDFVSGRRKLQFEESTAVSNQEDGMAASDQQAGTSFSNQEAGTSFSNQDACTSFSKQEDGMAASNQEAGTSFSNKEDITVCDATQVLRRLENNKYPVYEEVILFKIKGMDLIA